LWDDLEFLGTVAWCVGFFWFAASYTEHRLAHSKAVWTAHGLINGVYLALVFTDSQHHLIRPDAHLESSEGLTALVYSFTWPTLVAAGYLLSSFALSFVLLSTGALRARPPYRAQSIVIVAGTAVPVLGTVLTLSGLLPPVYRDISPLTFAAGDLLIAWGLFRHRMLDLVPIARDIVLENLRDTVVVLDAQQRVLDANPAMLRALGREASQVIGKPAREVFSEWSQWVEAFQHIQEGEVEFETVVGDEPRSIALTIAPVRDRHEKLLGRVLVSHDITELQRAKLALERTNAELRGSNRDLDAFSYSISHDLRAPIRAMTVFSKRLLEVHGKELSPDVRELVERVHHNAEHMRDLTNALLAFAKLGRQPLRDEPVDLTELAKAVARELTTATERKLEIRVDELPPARGDSALLRQVLTNLLDNAVKFTRKEDHALIEVGSRLEQGKPTYFVRDNGAGFDMEYAERLFGVFQRLHDQSEFEGTGVGLASAKQIIERHGGRIWAEAEPGRGATFYFTLS
ncbi:MAG TPA: histidine kinase N-terminal 7TM domain-containing protein, partial [Polyangiaceae bacterium]|nr:histidine kinase N-terminal 7TM domain-containing protein [Polyangiaceae bacterium]